MGGLSLFLLPEYALPQNNDIEITEIPKWHSRENNADSVIGYATEVSLYIPTGLDFDDEENLFFIEPYNNRILKMDQEGMITVVAGTGLPGFAGDGGPAIDAQFNFPQRLSFDQKGNLFIVDSFNCRIRKINPDGIITTIAGTGKWGFSGDGGPALQADFAPVLAIFIDESSNIYLSDWNNSCIRMIDTNGIVTTVAGIPKAMGFSGDGEPATEAMLNRASDMVKDSKGNLYIADHSNNRIRMVDLNGIISTIAGNGELKFTEDGTLAVHAGLYNFNEISIDSSDHLYISEDQSHRIRKIDDLGYITTVAGSGEIGSDQGAYSGDGGQAIHAQLNTPSQVIFDKLGNLYFSDLHNHCIRKIDTNGIITTIAGNGSAGDTLNNILYSYDNNNITSTSALYPWYLQSTFLLIVAANGIIGLFVLTYYFYLKHKVDKSKQELSIKNHDLQKEKEARLMVERELQFISEREQTRIGQDLHDSVIQQLTGVKMIGESLLEDYQKQSGQGSQYMKRLNEMLMQSIQELRGLSQGLYPVELHKNGLHSALHDLSDNVQEVYKINCTYMSKQDFTMQDEMVIINMFRIVQEAVNNAVKHSKSTQIDIRLDIKDDIYTIIIKDNGIGFDSESTPHSGSKGMGLNIMKYRADIIGAELSITSEPNKGTEVQCKFPLTHQ